MRKIFLVRRDQPVPVYPANLGLAKWGPNYYYLKNAKVTKIMCEDKFLNYLPIFFCIVPLPCFPVLFQNSR